MRRYRINKVSRYKIILYLLTLLATISTSAQVTFVNNGGFETHSRCPYENDQIKFATGWTAIDTFNHPPVDSFGTFCAPEYLNTCAGNNQYAGIPSNGFYYHYPRTGNGMAQTMIDKVTDVGVKKFLYLSL